MEGDSIQEIGAIEMDCKSHKIVDVFHSYARTEDDDTFARRHIHGLNPSGFETNDFPTEDTLVRVFKIWLHQRPCKYTLVANDPRKEANTLGVTILDLKLAPWTERNNRASHQIALRYKELSVSIRGRSCSQAAHSCFVSALPSSNIISSMAKEKHGFHCALYDAVELYFEWLML